MGVVASVNVHKIGEGGQILAILVRTYELNSSFCIGSSQHRCGIRARFSKN